MPNDSCFFEFFVKLFEIQKFDAAKVWLFYELMQTSGALKSSVPMPSVYCDR